MTSPIETPLEELERVSVEEYLRREELATEKHEYYDGYIIPLGALIAMSGGSLEHGSIANNLNGALWNRLKGAGCRAIDSTVRVAPSHRARYFYPDVTVYCGEPKFDATDKSRTTLTNPVCVFEVQSPSTEKFDRGKKFDAYREIESLREFVLVEQARAGIQTFYRQNDGTWLFAAYNDLAATVPLRSLGIDLPLSEVYAGVGFDPPPPAPADPPANGE